MQDASGPMMTAVQLYKTYRRDAVKVPVLQGVNLEVYRSEFLCVIGASGSGKSTLLHLLGTIDQPDKGEITLDGERIDNLPSERRDRLRNRTFGYVFSSTTASGAQHPRKCTCADHDLEQPVRLAS